jgi:phosphoribosylformylglycinamidine synthase
LPVSKETLDEIALSEKEYQLIVDKLGREPTDVELGMFGALWSEHCGYKHSRLLIDLLPSRSRLVKIKPGEENAGAVSIGDGVLVVFKMESHNHPSAIEPYQGAATGVGGIVRDIFTMGARPIALANSLRFGPLIEPRNRYLLNGVVGGIAGYGNCLGIPDVCGEILFSPTYSSNPLVNALCLGIVQEGKIVKARASGNGNLLMLVGADTGRDGIHGASGLASRTFEGQPEMRSAVQVGNPFLEKLLIEACLSLAETDWIVGMQDLGAAGLTSSSVESAYRGKSGIEIDILKVPRREKGMTPYEVMLSESQERMLVIVKKGCEDKVKTLFDRWDLHSDIIGQVTGDGLVRVKEGEKTVAEVPADTLVNAPTYQSPSVKPDWLSDLQKYDMSQVPDIKTGEEGSILLRLLESPNISSKGWVYRQYDHQVMDNTVVAPGGDAAVLRIKGTGKAIAMSTDANGRYCYLDPYTGAAIAVAEAARNVVCTGAEPLAITDCINMGNPEKPDVNYQLRQGFRGIGRACRALKIPVISGNVSLYNETNGIAVYPTPVIGLVGLIKDVNRHCTSGFKSVGDSVLLLGDNRYDSGLDGSEYLELIRGNVAGWPAIDLNLEKRVQKCCLEAIRKGILKSAHDCSEGGLTVALAESCLIGNTGFKGSVPLRKRIDTVLFGERQSRIVVSLSPSKIASLRRLVRKWDVPVRKLGKVGGDRFIINGHMGLSLEELDGAWRKGWR